jgi:hypothetical protein
VKSLLLGFLVLWQTPSVQRQYFLYQRSVVPASVGLNCAVLDPETFAHASASLKDLRIFPQTAQAHEVPYVIVLSESAQPDSEPARVLNLGRKGHVLSFDLAMPHRPYTEVVLDLGGADYIGSATVTGSNAPGAQGGTHLGEFTLFDLSSQHLSHSTTLPLPESSFPYLHIELNVTPAPGTQGSPVVPEMVRGASVPPSREAQTIFEQTAETHTITQRGRQTVASFHLPQRVPVERVSFELSPAYKGNFSRDVTISDHATGTPASSGETIAGTIFRVHLSPAGREIRQQRLSLPATLGSNLQTAAEVEVAVENGDDQPLPITAVRLEMRQRRLCFDAQSTDALTLFYGDPALLPPHYDFSRTVSITNQVPLARLGPEQNDPAYTPRPDTRAATERHPELIWVAFLAVICLLGVIALRSSRHLPR